MIEGKELVKDAPVPHLLFLDKQVKEIENLFLYIPTLNPAEDWEYSEEAGCYRTPAIETVKTKKTPFNHVLYPATPEHPAQVEVLTKDEVVGRYFTVKFSGEIPVDVKEAMLRRCRLLREAIKCAREEANSTDVTRKDEAELLLSYLIGNNTISS